MPFTLSHAVLAPPLAKLLGQRLPIAALAIGCMLPDLHRLFTLRQDPTPHLWSALFYPNLFLGLMFCALWYLVYRPALYRFVGVHHPLNLNTIKSALGFVGGMILALLIGNATHLIWDGLTHHDFRSFAFQDFLAQSVQLGTDIYPMHRVLQIGSSILALPFLLWMSLHYYKKYQQIKPVSIKVRDYAVGLITLSVALGCFSLWDYARHIPDALWQEELYYFTGRAINEFSQGALLMLSLGCLLFLILDFQRQME
ncbi:hypothetical protein DSM16313_07780 [Acinetobacter seohaensis]|nr:hypothetical protein DSM16313_07780 [Acinetobacter seohaensis]